jgi:putative two-component system response regulator
MENQRQTIMLVDDNTTSLTVGKDILKNKYNTFTIASGKKLFELLAKISPDLILLDIEMPEMNGYEVIKNLKADPKTADIPVIFLTAHSDPEKELEGLSLGAIDYISKPFSPPLLMQRIENHLLIMSQKQELKKYNDHLRDMVIEQIEQIAELQYAVLGAVSEVVEFRDDIAGGHIERTQSYLKFMIDELNKSGLYADEVSTWDLDFLIPSSQLHDVGKIIVSEKILNKAGKLDPEEYNEMKKHTIFGVKVIERIMETTKDHSFLRHARIFAGTHHEKWDGSGYPLGLREKAIPLEGRLMAIADVYDALIAIRPYKQPFTTTQAEKIIIEGSGTFFDPELVNVFKLAAPNFAKIVSRQEFFP